MDINGTRILVTGGTGCIGRELIECLKAENLSKITIIGRKNIDVGLKSQNVEYISGNICDSFFMEEQIKNCDIIVHLAAKVHSIPGSKKEEEDFYEINFRASTDIFSLAAKYNVKKVVFVSSVAVFGDKGENVANEDYSCMPLTPYGKSKLLAENYLIKLSRESNLPMTILRPTTVFGNRDIGNIAKLIKLLRKGIGIVVDRGLNEKSFVYSKDVARAIVQAIKNDVTNGQIYIITGFSIRVRDFIETAKKTFNIKSCTISIPLSIINIIKKVSKLLYLKINALGCTNLYDGSKFINETGFKMKYNLKEGLEDSYEYYKNLH